MNLLELSKRSKEMTTLCKSILIYGPSKSGKTYLAGCTASIPAVNKIYFFSLENGHETLLNMGLADKELEKVILINIPDTRSEPRAAETILKAFTSSSDVRICHKHGKISCKDGECQKPENYLVFNINKLGRNDVVILDTLSQLGDSCLKMVMLGKAVTDKPEWEHYAAQGFMLSDILGIMQACSNTNFIAVTHWQPFTEEVNGKDVTRYLPSAGTSKLNEKICKFFGDVVLCQFSLGKYRATTNQRPDAVASSRTGAKIDGLEARQVMAALLNNLKG